MRDQEGWQQTQKSEHTEEYWSFSRNAWTLPQYALPGLLVYLRSASNVYDLWG
jgi:hypothetical protein